MRRIVVVLMLGFAFEAAAQALTPKQIMQVYQGCSDQAYAQCGRNTIRCNAYRRAFLKSCMTMNGVPPDYIFMLLN